MLKREKKNQEIEVWQTGGTERLLVTFELIASNPDEMRKNESDIVRLMEVYEKSSNIRAETKSLVKIENRHNG